MLLTTPFPPPDIARRLPDPALLHDTLLTHVTCLDAGAPLVRAAWNEASILPPRVGRTYRFGPSEALRDDGGAYPFHWIYAAGDAITPVWEAGLCLNDSEQPGTFYIERGARSALIATLRFGVPLRLVNLNGLASSKLGIFDEISSCDHAWCQWFGCMVDRVIEREGGRIHGMVYPSRKHRGHDAVAISSRVLPQLVAGVSTSVVKFGDTAACQELMADRCCVAPP